MLPQCLCDMKKSFKDMLLQIFIYLFGFFLAQPDFVAHDEQNSSHLMWKCYTQILSKDTWNNGTTSGIVTGL